MSKFEGMGPDADDATATVGQVNMACRNLLRESKPVGRIRLVLHEYRAVAAGDGGKNGLGSGMEDAQDRMLFRSVINAASQSPDIAAF